MKDVRQIQKYIEQVDPKKITSISDLEIREFAGEPLALEEKAAMKKFHEARINRLKKTHEKESSFHTSFEYFRTLSNLVDYRDILKDKVPL